MRRRRECVRMSHPKQNKTMSRNRLTRGSILS